MIASILLHTGEFKTASEALEYFGKKRTSDGKGVTIPSQIRYVNYYEKCLKNGFPKLDKKLNLIKITFNTIPSTSPGGSTPTFQISLLKNEIYDWSVRIKNSTKQL
jgi:phosphatidylinositol-3,4,5-trisphosphate 3-phosphatase and dual-specificity protein phosphatase PTEN